MGGGTGSGVPGNGPIDWGIPGYIEKLIDELGKILDQPSKQVFAEDRTQVRSLVMRKQFIMEDLMNFMGAQNWIGIRLVVLDLENLGRRVGLESWPERPPVLGLISNMD